MHVLPRLTRYQSGLGYSYAFGVFPALELLRAQPNIVRQILLHDPQRGGKGIGKILKVCDAHGITTSICPRAIHRIAGRPHPVVAVFDKQHHTLRLHTNHVLLHEPSYEGNVGTIMRTMLGFGLRDLAVIGAGIDLQSPSVVRASMGAVFGLRFAVFSSMDGYLHAVGSRQLCMFTLDANLTLEQFTPRPPFTLAFGSEGAGLPNNLPASGTRVRIPHADTIDSLNLAVAAGIAMYRTAQV